MNRLIGLCGKKYHGKDTVGDYLVKEYGYTKISFADKLKEVCKVMFNFTDEQLYGSKKEEVDEFWKVTPRLAMQFIGTDLFREQLNKIMPHIENNIWIEIVRKYILENKYKKIVICDVRFENEAKMIRELSGTIIKITRSSMTSKDEHQSETEIDKIKFDDEIINDGSIPDLYKKIVNKFVCHNSQINYIV
jgi:mannosyltransferase OCH1-like enzyme